MLSQGSGDTSEADSNIQLAPPLDSMRRTPQQERSRRMVKAILDAATDILSQYGRSALSTTSLEVASGVPKSSIYSYFPNLDAIVAEVFRRVIREHQVRGYKEFREKNHVTALEFTTWLIDWALEIHGHLLDLDSEFYISYSSSFDLWVELESNLEPTDSTFHFLKELLSKCEDFVPGDDDVMIVRALGRSAQLIVYALLKDNPEYIKQTSFRDLLIRTSYATIPSSSLIHF